jgi:purine-binding chemotaxis protein CheW
MFPMTPPGGAIKTDRVLAEIKRRQHVKDVVDVEEEQIKVVVFTCGGVRYGFHGAKVREILPPREISWVPCLPDFLPGLINVRGDIESVVDIRVFLGLGPADPTQCLIAMVVQGDCRFGVLIDAVEDVTDVAVSAIKPPLASLSGSAKDLVAGELEMGQGLVTLLDIEKLASRISA